MSRRTEKVQDAIRDIASNFFQREAHSGALLTITKASISSDLKFSTIYLTVFPTEKERLILEESRDRLHALREQMKKELPMKTLPYFSLEIDEGERNRQRIDELSSKTTLNEDL
jgi:ribosome-binding factor A